MATDHWPQNSSSDRKTDPPIPDLPSRKLGDIYVYIIYMYRYMCTYIYTYTHISMYTCMHDTCIHAYMRTCTHTHAYLPVPTYLPPCLPACMHALNTYINKLHNIHNTSQTVHKNKYSTHCAYMYIHLHTFEYSTCVSCTTSVTCNTSDVCILYALQYRHDIHYTLHIH